MNENVLSSIIINKAIEVHRILGPGLLENPYKVCLCYLLQESGLFVEKEKAMPLIFKGIQMDCGYRLDLLVENKVVIEVKSIETFSAIHIAQTLNYLKLGNFKLGLLINFNSLLLKDGIKRIVNNL